MTNNLRFTINVGGQLHREFSISSEQDNYDWWHQIQFSVYKFPEFCLEVLQIYGMNGVQAHKKIKQDNKASTPRTICGQNRRRHCKLATTISTTMNSTTTSDFQQANRMHSLWRKDSHFCSLQHSFEHINASTYASTPKNPKPYNHSVF
jgi:hypothetical protein